jgi:hypothetical protein
VALVAEAYRPFIHNASWTFRGTRLEGPYNNPLNYTNVIAHQGTSGVSVVESGTNLDNNGAYQQTMIYRNGEVHAISPFELGPGQSMTLDQVELRSPVRVDDQYTVLDIGNAVLGLDGDGDDISETFDLGIWSRVVGEEVIDCPTPRRFTPYACGPRWPRVFASRVPDSCQRPRPQLWTTGTPLA